MDGNRPLRCRSNWMRKTLTTSHMRQDVVEPMGDLDAEPGDARRHQRRRAADDHPRTQFQQAVDVAAGHAAMGDVADQADRQALDAGP